MRYRYRVAGLVEEVIIMSLIEDEQFLIRKLREDAQLRKDVFNDICQHILAGDVETAKGMLRTMIKATSGYIAISDDVGRNSKSIMRMLSPGIDPGIKAFMSVVRAVGNHAGCSNAAKAGGLNHEFI